MFARLHDIVKAAQTRGDLERVYKASAWAQRAPQLLEWIKTRQSELAAELADASLKGGTAE